MHTCIVDWQMWNVYHRWILLFCNSGMGYTLCFGVHTLSGRLSIYYLFQYLYYYPLQLLLFLLT